MKQVGLRAFSCGFLSSLLAILTASSGIAGPIGAPGIPHRWAPALKQAIGSAYESTGAQSPVWFTLAEGILTEVFYPTVDMAQIGDLQFLVTDGQSYFSEQKRDTISNVTYEGDGSVVHVTGRERNGKYSFDQEYVADPSAPIVRVRTTIHWNAPGLRLFLLFKPAIANTGAGNIAFATSHSLIATKAASRRGPLNRGEPVYAALEASAPFAVASAGYVGFSDGWQDLSRNFHMTSIFPQAGPGNVALTAELEVSPGQDFTYELALGFGRTQGEAEMLSKTSLNTSFDRLKSEYQAGWKTFVGALNSVTRASDEARRSAIVIKMHEDKRNRGAIIASMSKPAIPDGEHAFDGTGGYHLIWPRDLYHAAMGLLAAGDEQTAVDVLHYLQSTQQSDGSWSQNFWVDGTPYWKGLQLDEVSFPILLASQLQKRGALQLGSSELAMIRRAADFIVGHGPATPQDRWEEIGGYVPSTIAAEISALRAAARLTDDSHYSDAAEFWNSQVENWTLVHDGPHGSDYYLRVSPSGNPTQPEPIRIANGGGDAYAWDILDGGFLELVRLGLRGPSDPNILSTLGIYESPALGIAQGFPGAAGALTYRRYNRDAYGRSRVGGYWPLLAGERGHYAVKAGDLSRARAQLFMLESAALTSGLLPEQTLGARGPSAQSNAGLGVACPLVWAHAEDILLNRSIHEGAVFDSP
jgi:glucoamylase